MSDNKILKEPTVSLPNVKGISQECSMTELKDLVISQWSIEECSTFLLCIFSDLLDKHKDDSEDTPPMFGFDLACELRELSCEACAPDLSVV